MLVEELIAVDEHDRIERVYDSRDVTQDRQQHTDPELNLQNEQQGIQTAKDATGSLDC